MRASGIRIGLAVLLTAAMASFTGAASTAHARDRHKQTPEPKVEKAPPAEPEADTGWDQSAESIGKAASISASVLMREP